MVGDRASELVVHVVCLTRPRDQLHPVAVSPAVVDCPPSLAVLADLVDVGVVVPAGRPRNLEVMERRGAAHIPLRRLDVPRRDETAPAPTRPRAPAIHIVVVRDTAVLSTYPTWPALCVTDLKVVGQDVSDKVDVADRRAAHAKCAANTSEGVKHL